MKLNRDFAVIADVAAAFGRLCVETIERVKEVASNQQPPSGGCVLKRYG